MNPSTLYIIGNGFDRHHGIPSDYRDFGNFLKRVDPDTYRLVETYFTVDDSFWWEFETRLAEFDATALLDDASIFMLPYGAEDWSDSAHHDFQYETERVVRAISGTMRSCFADWVRQLEIPSKTELTSPLLNLDPTASFLTFNYTPSLQNIYGIKPSQVLHIHGSAVDPTDSLVLGQPRMFGLRSLIRAACFSTVTSRASFLCPSWNGMPQSNCWLPYIWGRQAAPTSN